MRLASFPAAAREHLIVVWPQTARLFARLGRRADLLLAVTLAMIAAVVGGATVAAAEPGAFYQSEFSPAVMRACGHGYVTYLGGPGPVLDFLTLESDSLECSDVDPSRQREPNIFGTSHRYLLESTALLWRLDEVSWDALVPLFAVLYGIAGGALFGIFRLFVGRGLSALGTLALVFSPLQLDMLRGLRDYAKAPFLLVALFLAGLLATRLLGPRWTIGVGALAGFVLGVGFGFRPDVLVALPILAAALVALWPGGWRDSIRVRAATLAATVAVFVLTALPILHSVSGGGNLMLQGVHGQSAPFTESLGLEQDLYSTGAVYNDHYAVSLTNAHDLLVDGNLRELHLATKELDEASGARYRSVVRHLPADFLVRADAATLQALDSARSALFAPVPESVDVLGLPGRTRDVLRRMLEPLDEGWVVVLIALIVGAARSPRLAIGALLAIIYLGSFTSFQAAVRHSFYLEFFWWVGSAYLAQELWKLATHMWQLRHEGRGVIRSFKPRRAALGVAWLGVVLIATTIVPLSAARAYQREHLAEILVAYDGAPRRSVAARAVPAGADKTLLAVPRDSSVWQGPASARTALFAVRFNGRRCAYPQLRPIVRYESETEFEDWSTELDVRYPRRGDARVTAYFVAFDRPTTRFIGIELPTSSLPCVEAFDAVTDMSRIPVLLEAALGADWRESTRFQTFAWEDRRSAGEAKPYVVANPSGSYSFPQLISGEELTETAFRADGVTPSGRSGWSFEGQPDGRFTYLTVSNPIELAAGQKVVVHGRLDSGAVRVGLQRGQQWFLDVLADDKGEFWAVLVAPQAGTFELVVANEVPEHVRRQQVAIDEVRVG